MSSRGTSNVELGKLRFGDSLSKEIKQKTLELLRQYFDCTLFPFSDLIRTNSIEMQIKCVTDGTCISSALSTASISKENFKLFDSRIIAEQHYFRIHFAIC